MPTAIPKIQGDHRDSLSKNSGGVTQARNTAQRATFRGNPVCFTYNNGRKCATEVNNGRGCKKDGSFYEHRCNFFLRNEKKYCLQAHCRVQGHPRPTNGVLALE